jgi:two-component system CheB/CheR fusion protein
VPTRLDDRPFLESVVDALPSPLFVKDEQHRWILMNERFCRLVGRPREQLLGRSDPEFFPPEQVEVFWRQDDLVFATGELNENEELITAPDSGEVHVIVTRKSLVVAPDGRRLLVGVISDVTARKELERDLRRSVDALDGRILERTAELRRLHEQLHEEDRRKNEFLGVLSHELRNPLAPIRNALYLIERTAPDAEQASRARAVITRQVEHLTRLVDDLLDVTRVARGKIQLRRERLELDALLRRALDDHRSLFEPREIDVDLSVGDGPFPVDGDPVRLAQVIGNLLQNAAKFTDARGLVRIRLEREGDAAALTVDDTGVGMTPETLASAFEPFTQADDTLHRSAGGLGLGLPLVRALVEMHGGTVEGRSAGLGEGAEFKVRLPLAAGVARAPSRSPAPVAGPRRVLVVEDNLDAAETLRMVLEMGGHEVEVAHDGTRGLEAVREFRPDVVLCDIGLPGMDGYAVARAVRQDPEVASTVLVAVTGYALPEDQRRAAEAGFDRHLAKPVGVDEIQEVLARSRHH